MARSGVLKAGALRHMITIQRATASQSDSGAATNTWDDVCTLRALVEPQGGTEVLLAGAYTPEATFYITARYWPGLDTGMRVKFKDRYFNVLNLANYQERNIWMNLLVQEGPGLRGVV